MTLHTRAVAGALLALTCASSTLCAQDSSSVRPHAIEYSDMYYTRLKVHKIGSYVILPLFAGEYFLGDKLIKGTAGSGTKGIHSAVAGGIGVVFGVNTITGVWNLWDARHDPNGRTLRYIHSALMIASDAGIAWAAISAGGAGDDDNLPGTSRDTPGARHHRNIAIGSMGIGALGTVIMWVFH